MNEINFNKEPDTSVTGTSIKYSAAWEAPTKKCLVCDTLENPKATIADVGIAWLCPECKSRLNRLLYPKEGE